MPLDFGCPIHQHSQPDCDYCRSIQTLHPADCKENLKARRFLGSEGKGSKERERCLCGAAYDDEWTGNGVHHQKHRCARVGEGPYD